MLLSLIDVLKINTFGSNTNETKQNTKRKKKKIDLKQMFHYCLDE